MVDRDIQAESDKARARCQQYVRKQATDTEVSPSANAPGDSNESSNYAVEMYGLRKTYQRGGKLFKRQAPFVAVRGNWLGIHEGVQCYGLVMIAWTTR